MILIPYHSVLLKFLKKIFLLKRLKIHHFNYSIIKISENDFNNSQKKYFNNPDFIIEGSKLYFYWKVEGELWIKIKPKIGIVKGNTTEIIITKNNRIFILEAIGIFSKKQIEIEIPISIIKTLNTKELYKNKVVTKLSDKYLSSSKNLNLISFSKNNTSNLALIKMTYLNRHKSNSYIEKQDIVKNYSFSTKKYNSINLKTNNLKT